MEIKKVIIHKKVLIGILILLILQLLFFAYLNRNNSEEISDNTEYINGYPEYVQNIINKAEKMQQVSIFSKAGAFSNANIEKTYKDYKKVDNVKPVAFDSEFLNAHFGYRQLFGFVLIAGILVVMIFRPERQKGIKGLFFSTEKGRGTLAVKRLLSIFVWDAVITALFYGVNLILSQIIYKGSIKCCLTYPVQSLEMFKDWTSADSIGIFLLKYYLYKVLILFAISVIIWMVFSVFRSDIPAVFVILIIAVTQFLLTKLPNDNTIANLFKYCNLYRLASDNSFFTKYKNINIFSHAVNKNTIEIIFATICTVTFSVVGILNAKYMRTYGQNPNIAFFEKVYNKINGFFQLRIPETYKILWSEKGIIILIILAAVLIRQTDFSKPERSKSTDMYFSFMERHGGVPDESSAREIEEIREEIKAVDARSAQIEEDYQNGLAGADEYIEMQMVVQAYMEDRIFLREIDAETEYLANLNMEGWYVNKYKYGHLFRDENGLVNLVTFLATALMCSGLFYYERKKEMTGILRQCVNGRKRLFGKKMLFAVVTAFVIGAFEIILELAANLHIYGTVSFSAPVQSLKLLEFVKWNCSIGTFLAFVYFMRIAVIVMIAVIAASLSVVANQMVSFMMAFVICVPTLLYMVGIEFMEKLSVVDVMSVSPYMIKHYSVNSVIYAGVFLLISSVVLYRVAYRKWCK